MVKREIPESEEKIEQKKDQRESQSQQKAKPESVQIGWFIIGSTHWIKISIFA